MAKRGFLVAGLAVAFPIVWIIIITLTSRFIFLIQWPVTITVSVYVSCVLGILFISQKALKEKQDHIKGIYFLASAVICFILFWLVFCCVVFAIYRG